MQTHTTSGFPRLSADDFPLLPSEHASDVSAESQAVRRTLLDQLCGLPAVAFSRLQYLQPQIGCFNACAFCSQSAGTEVWQFSRRGLRDLIAALRRAALDRFPDEPALFGAARMHRPGIMFPYLDNDVASYPYLDDYIRLLKETCGVRVRISTVGYSALNTELQSMHETIASTLAPAFGGIRFSLTPYTLGWNDRTRRGRYVRDLANALRTYKPLMESIGFGKDTACIELRFAPLIGDSHEPIFDGFIDGYHVIHAGPHLLVARVPGKGPEPARVSRLDGKRPVFAANPISYFRTLDRTHDEDGRRAAVRALLDRPGASAVGVYEFRNADGPYYAIDPAFRAEGEFVALHIYPRARRKRAGYVDSTRFFLNAVLRIKRRMGIGRRGRFGHATWRDVDGVLQELTEQAEALTPLYPEAARHIRTAVLPLVNTLVAVLAESGFRAGAFFDPRFTIDTGQIVNQGRALGLFGGLAQTADEPATPWEERGYGKVSLSSERGYVWRIAPRPVSHAFARPPAHAGGGKNEWAGSQIIRIEELDPRHLLPYDRETGAPLRAFDVVGVELEHVRRQDASQRFLYPGLT